MPSSKRPRLGRGLDAMLPAAPAPSRHSFEARIEEVFPTRGQPRRRFDEASLDELAASIREMGILEPILVRKRSAGGFSIIAGERRWRAAQRAGLREVPIFVRELSPSEVFEAALVENLQREDLNPIETARAFQRLVDDHSHTQETVAKRVGKDRSTVANAVRLLKLPDDVLDLVEAGTLSEGHGRAILAAGDPSHMRTLAHHAVEKGWSVRETERRARAAGAKDKKSAPKATRVSANVRDLELRLTRGLGTKARLVDRRGKGRIEISFSSYDELERLTARLLD